MIPEGWYTGHDMRLPPGCCCAGYRRAPVGNCLEGRPKQTTRGEFIAGDCIKYLENKVD